jgi:hypothetical protein
MGWERFDRAGEIPTDGRQKDLKTGHLAVLPPTVL